MNTIKIILTKGKYTLIDKEDLEKISCFKWCFNWSYGKNGYAICNIYPIDWKHPQKIYLHRLIIGAKEGELVDHINRDPFDNRKCNLRKVTPSENLLNRTTKRGKSKHKNVYWQEKNKKWIVVVSKNSRNYYGGSFKSEIEAAKKANELMLKHHGEFAQLNDV